MGCAIAYFGGRPGLFAAPKQHSVGRPAVSLPPFGHLTRRGCAWRVRLGTPSELGAVPHGKTGIQAAWVGLSMGEIDEWTLQEGR